jgi:hypothetical protein
MWMQPKLEHEYELNFANSAGLYSAREDLPSGHHIRRGISTYVEQNNEQDKCNNINREQHRMTLNYMPSLVIKKARGSSSALSTQLSTTARSSKQ